MVVTRRNNRLPKGEVLNPLNDPWHWHRQVVHKVSEQTDAHSLPQVVVVRPLDGRAEAGLLLEGLSACSMALYVGLG